MSGVLSKIIICFFFYFFISFKLHSGHYIEYYDNSSSRYFQKIIFQGIQKIKKIYRVVFSIDTLLGDKKIKLYEFIYQLSLLRQSKESILLKIKKFYNLVKMNFSESYDIILIMKIYKNLLGIF